VRHDPIHIAAMPLTRSPERVPALLGGTAEAATVVEH
jgi:hypothetical protein